MNAHSYKPYDTVAWKHALIDINLDYGIFQITSDNFTVKVAETVHDACTLLGVGFEHIPEMDVKNLFRKRT